jgi:hypothetical protein
MNRLKILGFSAMFGIFLLSSSPARADEATHILTDATLLTEHEHDGLMYVVIGAGAVAGIAVLNILTGGMALAPIVGAGMMDSSVVAAVAADGGLAAGVELSTRWAAVALAAIGGGIAGAALYD